MPEAERACELPLQQVVQEGVVPVPMAELVQVPVPMPQEEVARAAQEAAEEAAAKAMPQQLIQLKVKDQQGGVVQFRIKKSTPLRKFMELYCSRLGLQASQVHFTVDGERLAADDTAQELGLENEEELIAVHV